MVFKAQAEQYAVAGECSAPAYLANVCVAKAAHRQGIGRRLIDSARTLANDWGVLSTFNLYRPQGYCFSLIGAVGPNHPCKIAAYSITEVGLNLAGRHEAKYDCTWWLPWKFDQHNLRPAVI